MTPRPAVSPRARARRALVVPVVALGSAAVLAGCWPGQSTGSASTPTVAQERAETKGGVLRALSLGPVLTWDPQRIGTRDAMAFAGRIFARTLTAYAPSTDPARQGRLVGDLATDTGTASSDLKTWRFTLRTGVSWEDGSPVTCDDVRYGISRTFATDDITGGPTDALAVLDVPKNPDGTSTYAGPYATGAKVAKGAGSFASAVECSGSTITFHLAAPLSDFNELLTQPALGPYKKSKDQGNASTYAVFSNGPYRLSGTWRPSTGGTFVRNPRWKAASDPIRKAYPNEIRYQEGIETQTVAQQIMADGANGRTSVSLDSAPPALQQHIIAVDTLRQRAVNPSTGLVDYLVPNARSRVMRHAQAREALALATNRAAYVTALGGATSARATSSLVPGSLVASRGSAAPTAPDSARARQLLTQAKLKVPVPITVTYRKSDTADKAMAALVAGWRDAGFDPQLEPITDGYFIAVSRRSARARYDVIWSNWEPAWASASTILPPLFDSSINLTATGPGRDYGYWDDKADNRLMASINATAGAAAREKAWGDLDRSLVARGAYIALAERRALYIAGSDVRNLTGNEVAGGVVEFADIAVVQ